MHRMMIDRPDVFAAGAVLIANLGVGEFTVPSPRPMFLMLSSPEDNLMPFEGGDLPLDRGTVRSAEDTRDFWITGNSANPVPMVSTLPDRDTVDNCLITSEFYSSTGVDSAPVQYYQMNGAGHVYATTTRPHWLVSLANFFLVGPPCHDAEAADLAWEFMSQFTL